MKFVGLGLFSVFLFSFVNVAHSGIFDTLLHTARDIGSGVQSFGDDVIGAFVDTRPKCPHGGCATPVIQPVPVVQPVQPVLAGGGYPGPYIYRKAQDSQEVNATAHKSN